MKKKLLLFGLVFVFVGMISVGTSSADIFMPDKIYLAANGEIVAITDPVRIQDIRDKSLGQTPQCLLTLLGPRAPMRGMFRPPIPRKPSPDVIFLYVCADNGTPGCITRPDGRVCCTGRPCQ
jgi:hypothetical protein